MPCLIGVRDTETGGKCFVLDSVPELPEHSELMSALTQVNSLPLEHRPETIDYKDAANLALIAATAGMNNAFELWMKDGKPAISLLSIQTVVLPPGIDPDELLEGLEEGFDAGDFGEPEEE
jgi:hypothetical protein